MTSFTKQEQIVGLVVLLGIVFLTAAVAAAASIHAGAFYVGLVRPAWAPPPTIFGPVWTLLYALMGVAAWLVWRVAGFRTARPALLLFFVQLALNGLWSWVFFAWQRGALALLDIAILLVVVAATAVSFWRIKPLAGALLIPYVLWVGFACALNYSVWQLNPQVLG